MAVPFEHRLRPGIGEHAASEFVELAQSHPHRDVLAHRIQHPGHETTGSAQRLDLTAGFELDHSPRSAFSAIPTRS
ncbi:hypothetical protein GCM10009854_32360 [Saccharopolyspora halophila]|uniref:Uncharacterized protein n=1 Tax=Saccharopolyspora halophila TaxID=405551 RepID=A0ABN3GHY2_9PSEU